ncbi:putative retrotransposon hot spot (RHS) protein [Trypanosoma cruzi]|nr:putative retrotransposon hot spot (RHS) protein [Trypanosoma cruzi]
MPGGSMRVQGGNAESQASAVPQGDGQRRARQGFESETDEPDETRRRVEEARRPQWTLLSRVEDVMLEGSTSRTNMKLNDFLRNHVGGRAAVDEDHNVTMEMFVQDPEMFIQNERLLRIITALLSYKELEAIYKLHCEGVFSLWQWNIYERKDTATHFARGKLDAAISQVLNEERRETEESRWAEEWARRRQKVELTVATTIKDVLFRGRVRVMEMQLNDFLVMELDGMGILPANRNVLLKDFVKDSARYIHGTFLLLEMQASNHYKRMERAVRDEMDMEEDVLRLYERSVDNLLKWSLAAEEVKRSVHCITKHFLDAAFIELMSSVTMSAPMKLEGCYESVYNARWSHVVEVCDGEKTGLEVREGEAPQSWNYRAVGRTLEMDDGVQQSGALRSRLMVLASEKGWPYSWNLKGVESAFDCHVNCEVERVWRIVRNDLTKWFSPDAGDYFKPKKRLLIGTPGIGKSMNAGSYLLYQLLHYDVEKLQMVVYFIGRQSFLFDKITKTVSLYMDDPGIVNVVKIFSLRGVKGYCIYDAALACRQPPAGLPCKGWGMIVVTPPDKNEY